MGWLGWFTSENGMRPEVVINNLHNVCSETMGKSFEGENATAMVKSYSFSSDLNTWCEVLSGEPEVVLYRKASQEYLTGLLTQSLHKS